MNALTAALQILALSNEPLSKQEIARRAIESGIWVSTGKTPYETIGSQIYTDIKKKGDRSEFVLVEPGVFTLRQLTQQTQRPKTDTPAQPQADKAQPQADKAQDPGTTTTNNKKTQPQTTQAKPQTTQAKPQNDAEPSPQPARSRLADPIRDDLQTIAEPQSFADCAYAILDSFACQKPMTFHDIAKRAVDHGLISANLPNPANAIAQDVTAEIQRCQQQAELPRFVLSRNHAELALAQWSDAETTDAQDAEPAEISEPLPLADCAQRVLEESQTTRPMHYRTLAAKAIEAGWLVSSSRTPEVSLYAQIITEIKQRMRKGEPQRFIRYKNGFIGLTAWNDNSIAATIQKHNQQVLNDAIQRLQQLSCEHLEAILTRLLAEMGFEDITMTHSQDTTRFTVSAILVAAGAFRLPTTVLFVREPRTIDAPSFRKLVADAPDGQRLMLIATCDFSPAVADEARKRAIPLVNAAQLAALLAENAVGIRKSSVTCLELDADELNG